MNELVPRHSELEPHLNTVEAWIRELPQGRQMSIFRARHAIATVLLALPDDTSRELILYVMHEHEMNHTTVARFLKEGYSPDDLDFIGCLYQTAKPERPWNPDAKRWDNGMTYKTIALLRKRFADCEDAAYILEQLQYMCGKQVAAVHSKRDPSIEEVAKLALSLAVIHDFDTLTATADYHHDLMELEANPETADNNE